MHVTSARAVNWMLKDKGNIYQWRTQEEEESADSFVLVSISILEIPVVSAALEAPLNLVISWHSSFEMRQNCELSKFLRTC